MFSQRNNPCFDLLQKYCRIKEESKEQIKKKSIVIKIKNKSEKKARQ